MVTTLEDRVDELERNVHTLARRLARVESTAPTPVRRPPPDLRPAQAPVAAPVAAAAPLRVPVAPAAPSIPTPNLAPQPGRRGPDLEELLGGRLLALVGGLAVLVGLVFLVALAIDQGWLDERGRVTLAFLGSGGLTVAGAWLYERRGHTQAARAAAAAGVAGLFCSLTAATSLYRLLPVPVALAGALAVGALGVVLALRWGSRTMAGLGILGALASPMLLNAPANLLTVGFLAVALAAASAVLIWQRWEWLQIAAFALAVVQVATALLDVPGPGLWSTVGVLGLFGALNLVAALGYEVRVPTATLRTSAALLVSANALIMGGIGYLVLLDDWGVRVAGFWLAAVCLAHFDAGLVALTWRRVSRAIGIVLLGVALTAGNLAFAVLVDGPTLAIGWALSALALAALARRRGAEGRLAQGTVAGQLTLAIVHTLMFDAPPDSLGGGSVAYAPLVACVIAAFGCARLSRNGNGPWRIAADAAGLVGLGYVSALALDGPALVVAWVAQALALLPIARRTGDGLATDRRVRLPRRGSGARRSDRGPTRCPDLGRRELPRLGFRPGRGGRRGYRSRPRPARRPAGGPCSVAGGRRGHRVSRLDRDRRRLPAGSERPTAGPGGAQCLLERGGARVAVDRPAPGCPPRPADRLRAAGPGRRKGLLLRHVGPGVGLPGGVVRRSRPAAPRRCLRLPADAAGVSGGRRLDAGRRQHGDQRVHLTRSRRHQRGAHPPDVVAPQGEAGLDQDRARGGEDAGEQG